MKRADGSAIMAARDPAGGEQPGVAQGSSGADALEPLLERWREAPCSLLADVLDTLPRGSMPEATKPGERLAWAHERALVRDPEALHGILQVVREQRGIAKAVALMEALLERWPADPRLTTVFAQWLEQAPFTSHTGQQVWVRVFRWLMKVPDARVRTLGSRIRPEAFGGRLQWMERKLEKLVDRQIADGLPTPEEQAAWGGALRDHTARMERRARAREQAGALLDAVYQDAEDLATRAILADALLEVEDPRGELLTLQLGPATRATRRREKELLARYQAVWLGPIAQVLLKSGRVWRNGFLTEGRLRFANRGEAEQVADEPAWRLVEVLDIGRSSMAQWSVYPFLEHADLASLRRVTGIKSWRDLHAVLAVACPLCEVELVTVRFSYAEGTPPITPRHLERLELDGGWFARAGDLGAWLTTDELVGRGTLEGLASEPADFAGGVGRLVQQLADLSGRLELSLHAGKPVVVRLRADGDAFVVDLHDTDLPDVHRPLLMTALHSLRNLPLRLGHVDAGWRTVARALVP